MAQGEDRPVRQRKARAPTAKEAERMERARRAKELMGDPLMQEALDAVDDIIDKSWKNSTAQDRDIRDTAYLLHRLMVQFRAHFEAIIADGTHAAKLLELEGKNRGIGP